MCHMLSEVLSLITDNQCSTILQIVLFYNYPIDRDESLGLSPESLLQSLASLPLP